MHRTEKLTLTFDDLPRQEAVKKLFEDPEFVRSESILITDVGREWILQKVIWALPQHLVGHYRFEHLMHWQGNFDQTGKGRREPSTLVPG